MLNKIIGFISSIIIFFIFHNICRMSASYFPKSKIQKYIIINNKVIAQIFIARQISRDKFVSPFNYNKMSIVGLITYIVLEPINIYALVVSVMDICNCIKINNLNNLYQLAYSILGGLALLVIIVVLINTNKCDKSY